MPRCGQANRSSRKGRGRLVADCPSERSGRVGSTSRTAARVRISQPIVVLLPFVMRERRAEARLRCGQTAGRLAARRRLLATLCATETGFVARPQQFAGSYQVFKGHVVHRDRAPSDAWKPFGESLSLRRTHRPPSPPTPTAYLENAVVTRIVDFASRGGLEIQADLSPGESVRLLRVRVNTSKLGAPTAASPPIVKRSALQTTRTWCRGSVRGRACQRQPPPCHRLKP